MDKNLFKQKVYDQGRDLEVAIFNTLFEGDEREMVAYALSIFQNKDGGFGHGLEPDSTNPNSSPFQTSVALEILCDVGFRDDNLDEYTKDLINRAFKYLLKTLENDYWPSTVPSNNDFPCAIWWMHDPNKKQTINPTGSILGSTLLLANKSTNGYKTALTQAIQHLKQYLNEPCHEKHDLAVLARLYHALKEVEPQCELLGAFKEKLFKEIQESIDPVDQWEGYATMPFDFPLDDENYGINPTILSASVDYLKRTLKNNYWEPSWQWYKDEDTFEIQSIKWHGILINKFLSYISHIQK
ncbi:hypothetical protein [Paracholeplasma manati]|uniref:hypothetical protein n=1 Tax=Paracholeplasma manati TaxID=591373 RepID=UPI002407A8DD|nr:hypothetical protein [Paracholeplasma manati]MDG0888544.1 hypothetical protein [Paracholeplasma manati]